MIKEDKKIYKINPTTMLITDTYNKVSDITSDRDIYRVINGNKQIFKDGYMYRKACDITINNETGVVTDLLSAKSKRDKAYNKYEYTINLLNNSNYSISEICELSRKQGIKVCEATCRKLKKEYGF